MDLMTAARPTMESMVDESFLPPPDSERGWTVDDLDRMPDDGYRYELFDGILVVSPAPAEKHQLALLGVYRLLYAACPADLQVLTAPYAFRPTGTRSFEPDVLVYRVVDAGEKYLAKAPQLVVEVLSDSTRSKDLVFKRALYESSGVRCYWIVDPKVPDLTVLERRRGHYVEVAKAVGGERVQLTLPFPVTVCPAELVAR